MLARSPLWCLDLKVSGRSPAIRIRHHASVPSTCVAFALRSSMTTLRIFSLSFRGGVPWRTRLGRLLGLTVERTVIKMTELLRYRR